MKILTKRNAMLGWATWKTAKGVAKYHKAKGTIPSTPAAKQTKKKKKKKRLAAGALAAVGSVALLKRMRKRGSSSSYSPGSNGE